MKRIYIAFYIVCCALAACIAVTRPIYGWDALAYIAAAQSTTDPLRIHSVAMGEMRAEPADLNNISENRKADSGNSAAAFAADMEANPYHFAEQLPLYSIKPLYVIAIKFFHAIGFRYKQALILPNAISFFLLALLLWKWLSRYLQGITLMICCMIVIFSQEVYVLARTGTPDCLSLLFVTTGLYWILEKHAYSAGMCFLLISIWVRPDTIVLAGIVLTMLVVTRQIDAYSAVAFSGLALLSYWVINHVAGGYGWTELMHNSLITPITNPADISVAFGPRLYLRYLAIGSGHILASSIFSYFLVGIVVCRILKLNEYRDMLLVVLLSRCVSFLLYPNPEHRYMSVLFVFVPVCAVIALSRFISADRPNNSSIILGASATA